MLKLAIFIREASARRPVRKQDQAPGQCAAGTAGARGYFSGHFRARPISRELPPRGRLTTGRRKLLALDLLGQGHTLAHVRKVLGINRVTVYRWRQDDPSFAEKPRPFGRPGNVSAACTALISSTVLGLSRRLPFNWPPFSSIWPNWR
jgi:hypothetical protein